METVSISKSEVVRTDFKNIDFLAFNELHSRIVFSNNLSARQTREATIKFAVKFSTLAVRSVLTDSNAGLFVSDNENELYDLIVSKAAAQSVVKFDPLMAALEKLNKKVKPDDDAQVVELNREDFDAIITAYRAAKHG
jgi:hypothetical protein